DVESVEVDGEGDVLLNTGSPHLVRRVENLDLDVVGLGAELRYGPKTAATNGANINFVEVVGEGRLALRTYERGVENETLACGTGATATAIAVCHSLQPDVSHFYLKALGGDLEVEFTKEEGGRYHNIFLTGPARLVFAGELDTENF
ncbi:MAG: diaminopimelate epimerase, partial [Tidjanibacter sp.]|nr:diaminopimelate epimerase [Tidjanibacter sp.]